MSRSVSAGLALLVLGVAPAAGQGTAEPKVVPTLRNVTRVESWSFFDPEASGADSRYGILGNRATLGMRVESRRLTIEAAVQYAQLVGLPEPSSTSGPLGPGPVFFHAAGNSRAYQLYFKSMSLRIKDIAPDLSVAFGRMAYESGEGTPFAGRLIGNAEWTMFERAFDGVRIDYNRATWRAHASFLMPTQGAFEESASPTIGKVQLATATLARNGFNVFAHNYRDTRAIHTRPDNKGVPASRADIDVQTIGASLVRGCAGAKQRRCTFEFQLWGAAQRGEWYGDRHRALSAIAEGGYRWAQTTWAPSLHAGVLYASGDDDPNDTTHGTFFPMVPTTKPAVLGGTYAQMNLRDIYAVGTLMPHDRFSFSAEVHRLALVNRVDRWYSGTGATAFSGTYFGYSSRPSTLATGLGTFFQVSAASSLTPYWHVSATLGVVRGGSVVRRQFRGGSLRVFALENTVSFP